MQPSFNEESAERWLPVPGYEGWYDISDRGRVRRIGPSSRGQRILKPSVWNGYPHVNLCVGGIVRKAWVHRLVAIAFRGAPPSEKHEVAHWDGNRANVAATNLRWALPTENNADKKRHGTYLFGETTPNAKLSEGDVLEIRRRCKSGECQQAVADRFGVAIMTVNHIVHRRTWSHVEPTNADA